MTTTAARFLEPPDHSATTADAVRAATDLGLADADAALARAVAIAERGIDGSASQPQPPPELRALEAISDALRAIWTAHGRGAFLAIVHPDAGVRAAADEAGQRLEAWRAGFLRNREILGILEGMDEAGLDPEANVVRGRWTAALRGAGAHLDGATRAELGRLQARVFDLQSQFVVNQNADQEPVTISRAQLAGLPPAILDGLAAGDEPGVVVVPIGLRQTVLERVRDRGVREMLQRRWLTVAQEANRAVAQEIADVHRRMANLLGASSWAELRAASGTIGGLERVRDFLGALEPPFAAARDRQLAAIRRPLAAELGVAEDEVVVEDWDVPRGLALLRDEVGADGSGIRAYFPIDSVLAGLARTVEAVFGVRLVETDASLGWHPDVRHFDCSDRDSGRPIGTILLDPYARDGKMPGVAGMCDLLALGGVRPDGTPEPTHAAIVLFIPRPDDGSPALLAPGDIEALFHELGHALDFLLGRTRFAPISVDGWNPDWAEAPSQFVGRWAALPEVLASLGRHVTTGESLALDRAAAFARANELGTALQQLRYLWFARIDQALHGATAVDLDDLWREAWALRGTEPMTNTFAAAPLTIINLGYDGVMYGFLWAQALLEEIIGRFSREGPLSPIVGAAYRRELLEPGWAPDPLLRMRRFLGREPTIEPFIAHLGR